MALSQRAFARLAGVSQQSVAQAAREGRLATGAGKLDPEHPVNAAFITAHRAGPRGNGGANGTGAQLAALTVKAQWQAERLARVVDAHVEKAAIAEGLRQTLDMLCEAAPLLPHRYGRVVATRLGIGEDVARALLQDVADLLLVETERLPGAGYVAAMRLS